MVLPGRRAARRLLELLAGDPSIGAYGLVPPVIVTPSQLPEMLYRPHRRLASPLELRLAFLDVLQGLPRQQLDLICPQPPAVDDLAGWLAVVAELEKLDLELSAAGWTWRQAAKRLEERSSFEDGGRWRVLVEIRGRVETLLRGRETASVAGARLHQLAKGRSKHSPSARLIALVGVAELPALFQRLLAACAIETCALIQAPRSQANAFDDWGCARAGIWTDRVIDIEPGQLHVAEDPNDVIARVVELVQSWTADDAHAGLVAQEVSIGLGDESKARRLADALDVAGVSSHSPLGRALRASRPAVLLECLAQYLRSRRVAHLAKLLRLPDFESFALRDDGELEAVIGSGVSDRRSKAIAAALERGDLLTALDRYSSDALIARADRDPLPGSGVGGRFVSWLDRLVHELLGLDPSTPRPAELTLAEWAQRAARALATIYDRDLDPQDERDAELIQSLELIGDELRQQHRLGEQQLRLVPMQLDQSLAMTLGGSRSVLYAPDSGASAGVELLGWLELALDDAPALIVTDLNEGSIPRSKNADQLLPNSARSLLGLMDNRRRYARDAYLLTTLLASRRRVALMLSRRGGDGETLRPSRLLLARAPGQQARAVIELLDPRPTAPRSTLWLSGERTALEVPRPQPLSAPVDAMSVTAFRDYLACPYRFYLRHVLGLETVRDLPRELDARLFGELSHDVLRRFAVDEVARSGDADAGHRVLVDLLQMEARDRFGTEPPPAVRVQLAQLERRLGVFASWHSGEVRAGWRVRQDLIERRLSAQLQVDGRPFTVTGRVDRVDEHEQLGQRIIDYKTADRPRRPEEIHRSADRWVDLQLPLYRELTRALGIDDSAALGYVTLSKKLDSSDLFLAARWSSQEQADAIACAFEVVRAVRSERFWPPQEPPSFDDGLGRICGDGLAARHRHGLAVAGQGIASAASEPTQP